MSLTLSNLKPAKGAAKKAKRVGRGGKRGTYSGRGMKGQRARSGGKGGLKALGFKQTLQRIPKIRGFRSLKPKLVVVNLRDLEKFDAGTVADIKAMKKNGLIAKKVSGVKVLGEGKLTKKLTVVARAFSASAKEAIIKAGGQAELK
ncbi:MAG: 50S ribosomal protein L15 [Patescibacteria group bacterium]